MGIELGPGATGEEIEVNPDQAKGVGGVELGERLVVGDITLAPLNEAKQRAMARIMIERQQVIEKRRTIPLGLTLGDVTAELELCRSIYAQLVDPLEYKWTPLASPK